YADAGVPVTFIGHPLVGNVQATLTREIFCRKYGLQESRRIITVLPGSRRGEISHHLPILVEGLREIRERIPGPPQIVVAVAPGLDAAPLQKSLPADWGARFIPNDTYKDRKSTRLNSSHLGISYAVFCLKKKKKKKKKNT